MNKTFSRGNKFIAVSRHVPQVASTATRTGRETLLLLGLDVTKTSACALLQVLKLLQERLNSIETVVLSQIAHSQTPQAGLRIVCHECDEWLRECESKYDLPKTDQQSGARPFNKQEQQDVRALARQKSHPICGSSMCASALLGVIFIAIRGFVLVALARSMMRNTASRCRQAQVKPCPDVLEERSRLVSRCAGKWQSTPKDVVGSLVRAADWGSRKGCRKPER